MLKKWLNQKFSDWLDNQLPVADEQTLNRRVIFIVPSRFGVYFLLSALILFLLGTNYQNNLILMFSFLMIAIMFVTMFHTFYALFNLKLEMLSAPTMERANVSEVSLALHSDRPRHLLTLYFDTFLPIRIAISEGKNKIKVPHHPKLRGKHRLPRLTIETNYPLGLFRCWSKVSFKQEIFVYPKPKPIKRKELNSILDSCLLGAKNEQNFDVNDTRRGKQAEDIEQLEHYQKGQPLTRVSWKHVASGQGWYTKSFGNEETLTLSIDEKAFPYTNVEEKLSVITYVVGYCVDREIVFDFKLGGDKVERVDSFKQAELCFQSLAQY